MKLIKKIRRRHPPTLPHANHKKCEEIRKKGENPSPKSELKKVCPQILKTKNIQIPKTLSISVRNPSFITPFSTFSMPYRSRGSFNSGQCRRTCLMVCVSRLQGHRRSSRVVLPFIRPFSIAKLCEPVRYRVMQIR